ncbi:hypothetical protein [Methanoregula sp.]|uniref:hypothetical protein n=1 Tax=Methanoregula sp. TaxID=2052170 RepID=UPI0025E34608|nr:hypothetical protein [Methanoregula sp.]
MMKTIALFVITVCILVIAGCTAPASGPATTTTPTGTPTGNVLPMNTHTTLGSGNKTVEVYVHSFELGEERNGTRDVTVYVAARNTGTEPVMMVWFSKLTDNTGTSHGGIGLSHDGTGARSGWILPNMTEAARDYVTITSNQDLLQLSNGAVLDVYFMDKPTEDTVVSNIPDYHVTWMIDPGAIF